MSREKEKVLQPDGMQAIVGVAFLTIVAIALRLYKLDGRTLCGDEYGSLIEAQQLWLNLHSLAYFIPMHFWLLWGGSDFWVRLPSVFFGVLAIPLSYELGRRTANTLTGLLFAMLMAISPLAVMYSQTMRFYSLFLSASTFSLLAFWMLREQPRSFGRRMLFLIATLIVVTSHLFGILVVVAEGIAWFISSDRRVQRIRRSALVAGLLGGAVILIVAFPHLRSSSWLAFERLIGILHPSTVGVSRGLSLVNFVKVPFALYTFSLGEAVYPLTYSIVIPGAIVIGVLLFSGCLVALRNSSVLFLVVLVFVMLLIVFLVFEPLEVVLTNTTAPRYVIFALPMFLLVIAMGLERIRYQRIFIIAILVINSLALWEYYWGTWNYEVPVNINWRTIAAFVRTESNSNTVLLYDGRSADAVNRYFDPGLKKESLWRLAESRNLSDIRVAQRVVFVTGDFHVYRRAEFNDSLRFLESDFELVNGCVRYPTIVYVFDRKPPGHSFGYLVKQSSGEVSLPKEIYGLEFQDLVLPAATSISGSTVSILGSFALPNLLDEKERLIPLTGANRSNALTIVSNVTSASHLQQGETIAEIVVKGTDQEIQTFPLRLGDGTQDWTKECPGSEKCRVVLTWRKYIAFIGQHTYDSAWSDFQAKVFSSRLQLRNPTVPASIAVRYVASSGKLNVWGMVLN